jgi:hypothetical protein
MRRSLPVLIVLSVLVLEASASRALTPAHIWSERFGGTSSDFAVAVAVDPSGNIIMAGHFSGTANLGGGDLVSGGSNDFFIAKYSFAGAHIWSQRFGGTGSEEAAGVAVDASGNVVVTGSFQGTVDFGGGNRTSGGSNDIFVAKYNSVGVHQWSVTYGGSGTDAGSAVDVDNSGNVYSTGFFTGTVTFGGDLFLGQGGNDIVVQKHSSAGSLLWTQMAGGPSNDTGSAIAVDASGNAIVAGGFGGTTTWGVALSSNGGTDVLLAKYNTSGTLQWASGYGSVNGDQGYGVAVDAAGDIVMTGYFQGSADFGGGALSNQGSDVFLARYTTAGAHQWSRRFGGTGSDFGRAVAIDMNGYILATGYFAGTADLGTGPLASAGGNDIFIGRYDAAGAAVWAQRLGGTSTDQSRAIAAATNGDAILAGYFASTVNFGGNDLTSAGSFDLALARYTADMREPQITSVRDIGNDQGRQLQIRFVRSAHDQTGSTRAVTHYEAYRRDDPPPAGAATTAPDNLPPLALRAEGWTQVGTVNAHGETSYGIVVPTLGDSTATSGRYYSTFYIRAATADPLVFFDSPADSGVSVDNLSPEVPGGLFRSGDTLSWNESAAPDFDYFTVYGASVNTFAAAVVVEYTVAPNLDVTSAGYPYYFVTATDFSGNEGAPATFSPLSGVDGPPRSYSLSVGSFPNPFNPATTVSYTVPARGTVTVAIYDVHGARVATLVDSEIRETGAYRTEWNGRSRTGIDAPSGIYFARIEHAGATRTRKLVLMK